MFLLLKKLRFVMEDKSRQEKKVGEGLVDDLEEGSQCLIYLFFTLINFGDF